MTKPPPSFLSNKLNKLSFLILTVGQVSQLIGCSWSSCLNSFQFFSVIFGSADTKSGHSMNLLWSWEAKIILVLLGNIFLADISKNCLAPIEQITPKIHVYFLLSVTSPPSSSEPPLPMTASPILWPSFSVLRYMILHLAILKSHIVQMSRACQVIQIARYNWPAPIIIYYSSRNHYQHWFCIFFRAATKILHCVDWEPISGKPAFKASAGGWFPAEFFRTTN